MRTKKKLLVIALAAALPWFGAHAQTAADLQKEIDALKAQLKALQDKVEAVSNKATPAASAVDPEEFNRIKTKVEAAEDNTIESGLKGLKISGMVDPTYIYNKRARDSGFIFLNNFDGAGNSGTLADGFDGYAYDNSYFGQAMLDIQKETDDGVKWRLTLAPHKSANSGFNVGSIVHEASVSIPLGSAQTRFLAGQIPDWTGYEYSWAHLNPLVTHNLLFDFTIPSYYTGAGMEFSSGKWLSKFLVGSIDGARGRGANKPGVTYRVDYSKGEFNGFGFAGQHSRNTNRFDLLEVDGYFIRGDWLLQGQVGTGRVKGAAGDGLGGDAKWWGLSGLAGYKVTPRLQALARFDYISNKKNGGGVYGSNGFDPADDPSGNGFAVDPRNGFGSTNALNPSEGVNRYALSTGLNYLYSENTTLKFEVRYDRASGAVFYDPKNGSFSKSNVLLGGSVVVKF